MKDGCSAYRRGRTATGGGRARNGIEQDDGIVIGASNGKGDGREKGVVGVVGMDDAVVEGDDDMTRPELAILKFSADRAVFRVRRTRRVGDVQRERGCYVSD